MKKRRRLVFQLTPLLDLLLIVIFAQYMEVQQTAESATADFEQQRLTLEDEYEERRARLEAEYETAQASLEDTRQRYNEQFQSLVDQHHQAGRTLADALDLPGAAIEQVLKLRTAGLDGDADRLETAVARIGEVLTHRGNDLLQFAIRFDEMQKHVSVWEVHIQENGQAVISDTEQSRTISFENSEEFATRAFEASKSFTEPKPLVIILLSYGDCQAVFRRRASDGMTPLIEQLRIDAGNTRWFDYSLMGFRPTGPLLDGEQNQ